MNIKKKYNFDSRYLTLLLISSPLIIILYLSFKLKNDDYKEIMKSHYTLKGKVVNVSYKVVEVEYEINGQKYIYNDSKPYKNLVETENYECLVSKKDITNVLILYYKPYIDTINYKYDTINPSNLNPLFENERHILFNYIINGEEFERIQSYKLGTRPRNLKNLVVMYRIDNPSIGYLVNVK